MSELEEGIINPDIIEVGDDEPDYYEVVGFSDKRKAYWVQKIKIDRMADNLEKEVEEYEQRMGTS